MAESWAGSTPPGTLDALVDTVRRANLAIIGESLTAPRRLGMGTTLSLLAVIGGQGEHDPETLAAINVGDSRIYRADGSQLEKVIASAATRPLGLDIDVEPQRLTLPLHPGHRYLLCSDGLYGVLDGQTLAEIVRDHDDPRLAAGELVRRAVAAGGADDTTAVVVDVALSD